MKIAIPVTGEKMCSHFGHCEQFALIETDEAGKAVVGTGVHEPPPHEPGVLPNWLHELGADVVIAGGMGPRAQQILAEKGITVIVGAPAEPPEQLAAAYLNGTLQSGGNTCDHPPGHTCEH